MYGQPNFGGCGSGGFPGRPVGGACGGGGCGPRPWGGPCAGGPGGGGFGGGSKGGCFKGGFGKGTGRAPLETGFEDEDRSRDWYCPNCKERNFLKRTECYKCRTVKPKDVDCSVPPFKLNIPPSGTTCNGMVKSYNRKGFGFLMVLGADYGQDIYYTRENLSSRLQTRDIPGQHVTFELHRYPDGKLTALNIRPIGEEKDDPRTRMAPFAGKGGLGRDDEDRTRDWVCEGCSERNFVKRFECFKCGKPRGAGFSEPGGSSSSGLGGGHGDERPSAPPPGPPPRRLSPHAGSRAMREALAKRLAGGGSRSRSRSHIRKKKRRKTSSASSSDDDDDSSSGSSAKGKKKKNKKKVKKKRSRSSSSSSGKSKKSDDSSSKSSDCKMEEPAAAAAAASGSGKHDKSDPEVEAAKAEALEQLMKLQKVEPKEARMSEWRALLRKWHPDKNPDRVEVATAVFQFLQKGKAIVDTN